MTDTQEILRRIAALRSRLDQAHGLLQEADTAVATAPQAAPEVAELDGQVQKGAWAGGLLDGALRPLEDEEGPLPPRLTARAMRLLHQGRDLLQTLRMLAGDKALRETEIGPRQRLHRETLSMLHAVLRMVQCFPPAPSAQLRLCEGLEAVLETVQERAKVIEAACRQRHDERQRIDHLAGLFRKLTTGQPVRSREWQTLAEELATEARQGTPLRFLRAGVDDPFRFAAAHGLNVAQVLARVIVEDQEWQPLFSECVLAALVHDVGMVHVSSDSLAQPGAWSDEKRRLMERHPTLGAQMLARVFPPGGLIVETAQDHHERLDGSGYPQGKRDLALSAFTRLVAVCDVYAALCAGRPHRPAQDTRTALTDTLLLADKGTLDKFQAEKLLRLSFYPCGAVVELADGAVGVVVGVHGGEQGLLNPAKPIVLLLTGSQGQPLPAPRLIDLLKAEERSILRALPAEARLPLLGRTFPEMV